MLWSVLYHYERKQGTTTCLSALCWCSSLYHYERKQGTTTLGRLSGGIPSIIPLREKTENYTTTRENWELRLKRKAVAAWRNYTTTRENWELRPAPPADRPCRHYTTTRENWELRPSEELVDVVNHYTTTRENWELRQCDHIEEINFHHIVILAAAGSCAREGRIEHKKRKHRHSSEHGGKSLHRLHPKHHSALMFPFIIFYHRRAASRHPEVLIVDLTFSLLFSFFCLWRWRFMV